ncbi:aminotransferase class V-fold PLP-dependent enzyme [candidate division KSB1 bacterium]|nr:aminotransferase class V-fold PLP-dependent enzyme [candidate division KSB1 bacterium]
MTKRRIFFRNNGLSPIDIIKWWRYQKKLDLKWPQFDNRTVIFTYLGRIGNAMLCKLWHIQSGDEILVPSYNCGSEIDPFLCFGMKAMMYRVDSKLNIDIDDLRKRISKRTKIIYVTHYFGWPQHLADIAIFCEEHHLFLIEDCALSLFSNSSEGPIGRLGDAAIFSFRKTLPVPDGAALVLQSNSMIQSLPETHPAFRTTAKEVAPYIVRWLIHSMQNRALLSNAIFFLDQLFAHNDAQHLQSDNLDMPKDYYFSEHVLPLTISCLSSAILRTIDPEEVFIQRRKNYHQLYEGLADIDTAKPLSGALPEGVCPLLMPLVVPDVFKWQRELRRLGIKAIRWWEGFNKKLDWGEFPEAKKLKNELLVLPVHHYLTSDDINYMIHCLHMTATAQS